MEKRTRKFNVVKPNDPEKLIVYHAISFCNKIEFFLNDSLYVTAVDCDDGKFIIEYGEDEKTVNKEAWNYKVYYDYIKSRKILVAFLIIHFIIFCFVTITLFGVYCLAILVIHLVLIARIEILLLEEKSMPFNVKSKHSAEHMMINFLEKNRRLPRSMEEIKGSSRFNNSCGVIYKAEKIVKEYERNILMILFSFFATDYLAYFFSGMLQLLISFVAVIFICFTVNKFVEKCHFISIPGKFILGYVAQCFNTTKKVKDEDLILVYFLAQQWMQDVYPEFCNQDENYL